MDPIRNIKLRWLQGTLGDVTYQFSRVQFSRIAPAPWQPAINAFRCKTAVKICVDLAGVEKSMIDLTVEPRQVIIRGTREAPEPAHGEGQALQLLALEIDYGPFERAVPMPAEVDVEGATAQQENGLLWVYLPFKQ